MPRAILYDGVMCVGCRQCESACSAHWGLPYDDAIAADERLSERKLTTITTHDGTFARRLCMHCVEPTCASVCPVGALKKTEIGPVVYDETRCIGCRYCMLACPFQVPVYEWSRALPRVRKCDLCADRLAQGLPTACTEACPTGATVTGDRDALIAEARRRIAESPSLYVNHLFGETEAGGTSVLFLSAVPFERLGVKSGLPREPLPMLTWRVLSLVPDIALVGGALLGGVWWITHRREEVAAAERAAKEARSERAVAAPAGGKRP